LQARDRGAVWRALVPLAVGHALAIGAAVLLASALGVILPLRVLRWIVAASLIAFGILRMVRHGHLRGGGMRLTPAELATWSFLMASMHGAGLMVLPIVVGAAPPPSHHPVHLAGIQGAGGIEMTAPLIHTLGYLVVTTALAVIVYEKVGLQILRRAWINLDVIWGGALAGAGVVTLLV
jgi:hypothetical protein